VSRRHAPVKPVNEVAFNSVAEVWPRDGLKSAPVAPLRIPMKSAPIPKQIGMQSEQIGNPRSRSEATLGFCS
jgi:hypothetical protein